MYLGENTVAGRIYDKIKKIVKDLRFDPDDEEGRKKAKHLLTLRRYIQFSVMLTGFFLIMSAVNIYQKSWAMFQTTVLGAAMPLLIFHSGMLISTYFLIFLFLLFYTPLSYLLQYEYGEFFRVRFPLLYAISYGISWFGFYKLHESKLQNYRHRQRLIELKQEVDYANNAKSQFLANMSHEIRTPINGILGMNSILVKECKDDHLLEYARDIQSASLTLLSIVNDILDISKIESGKMDILPVQFESFQRLEEKRNRTIEGTGLGLNLTKRLIEMMGGMLTVPCR